ncbi:MAG: aminotransferase class I/II-fold pyridoxal phosphate-dependent enzyme [Actinomycetia bacterium]|nr:aminotransferase class I/II-fold pyridoxal phosphate-dependent enzyme [Actinomycetes bacterium]
MAIFNVPLDVLRQRTSMKWTHYPPDVLPMWVAEMDCLPSPGVRRALARAVEIGDLGYPGYDALPQAFIRFARDWWNLELDEQQVMPCSDVVGGMSELVDRLTSPGAEVVIASPTYPPFRVTATTRGRRLVEVATTADGRLDLTALAAAFARDRVEAFLLCNPQNPHGTVPTLAELTALARLAAEHGVRVISDEIHAPLVAPGVVFTPYLSVPGTTNAYAVVSASKSFNLAALKAGLLVAGTGAVDEMWSFPYEVQAGSSHLGLMLQAAALDQDRDWLAQLNQEVAEHKQLLAELLAPLGLAYQPSQATYLAWVDASATGWERPAEDLLERGRVAFNPGTDYRADHASWVRVNLATSPELVQEGVRRVAVALGR